jgi:hypothetical protein
MYGASSNPLKDQVTITTTIVYKATIM